MARWSDPEFRRRWVSWLLISSLCALCLALAVLQYRSLRDVSEAESFQRREALQSSLRNAAAQFDTVVTRAARAIVNESSVLPPADWESAYARGYLRWHESGAHPDLFRRIYRLVPPSQETGSIETLRKLEPNGLFADAEWPTDWYPVRDNLHAKIARGRLFGPIADASLAVFELPRFLPGSSASPEPRTPEPIEWLLFELDLDYVRKTFLPQIVDTQFTGHGVHDFAIEVRSLASPPVEVFRSGGVIRDTDADASVRMFDIRWDEIFGPRRRQPGFAQPPPDRGPRDAPGLGAAAPPPPPGERSGRRGPPPNRDSRESRGRWELLARHKSGSLQAAVSRAHMRNAALTGAILALILGGSLALIRFNRNAQRLAELQVEFISGISHELRTPLSVISSAAFNLKKGVVKDPDQTKKYGQMIHAESERLTAIVEQVLHFARSRSSTLAAREPMAPGPIVEDALEASTRALAESGCAVEKAIEPELPPISGDPVALKQAIQNLIGNAAKYGWEGGWIGVSALRVVDPKGKEWVEFRVADRGPGIPSAELGHIFTPFYRGKRAVDDQVHGTGLGLNLAKKIVEAHNGTISASSEAGRQTEFVIRIPTIPAEQRDEFANIAG